MEFSVPENNQQVSSISDPMEVPMIFFRIGWMKRYCGINNDEIRGGGSYVDGNRIGHEIYNFNPCKGKYYGYVRPTSSSSDDSNLSSNEFIGGSRINLARVASKIEGDSIKLEKVLVVWVARNDQKKTVVVGWYGDATVYSYYQEMPPESIRTYDASTGDLECCGYYACADVKDSVLLPVRHRTCQIPSKKETGNIGQSNVWYAGLPKKPSSMEDQVTVERLRTTRRKVLDFINNWKQSCNHQSLSRSNSVDINHRLEVENAAIYLTMEFFSRSGYQVVSVEQDNLGWDLEATNNETTLRLEVKGLTQDNICVELTPNEYQKMKIFKDTYLLCVVTEAINAPKLSVFGYNPKINKWQDDEGRILELEKKTAARCRVV